MTDQRSRPRAAYVEEENPETGEAMPGTAQSANSAVKRYHLSMRKSAEKALRPGPRDAASDSGYSSHTNITGASGSSDQPPKVAPLPSSSSIPKLAPEPVRRNSTARPRRESKVPSPEKQEVRPSPQRRQSTSYRYSCNDPACKDQDCQRPRHSPEKRSAQPPLRPLDARYAQAQYIAQPGAYLPQASPVLPVTPHYSPGYAAPPIIAYANSSARPRAASRPQSYHAGITPPTYWGYPPAGTYQPPPVSHEQYAAYEKSYAQAYPRPDMMPPNLAYASTSPPKPISASVRPSVPHAMTTESYSTRNRAASNAANVGTYELPTRSAKKVDEGDYSTRPTPKRRDSQRVPGQWGSDSESSDEPRRPVIRYANERERDRIAMPPPTAPIPSRRPSLKQNLTTSDAVPRRSDSRRDRSRSITKYHYDESPRSRYEEEERREYFEDERPEYLQGERPRHKRTSSARQRSIETTSSGRTRQTYYSDQPVTRVVDRSGRRTDYREERTRRQADEAMAHIDSIRGHKLPEVTAETLRKKENRQSMPLGGSNSRPVLHHTTSGKPPSVISTNSQRSHRSRHSVNNLSTHDEGDEGSRVSRAQDGSLRIRMDARDGTTIEFSGDMEGRTISLRPAEEGGAAELVIGGARGEKRYGGSIRSGTASGSGRTSRSRAESETSRGRRQDSRSRRRSGVSEGFYEQPM